MRAMALLSLVLVSTVSADEDIGFELLATDVDEEVQDFSLSFTGSIPDYVRGRFVQTGPAKWSWKGKNMTRKFTHLLDGFAKVHECEFKADGSVLFSSQFLKSGFYKKSVEIDDISWDIFAQPTDPPIKNPGLLGFVQHPNDNNNVNVISMAGKDTLYSLSDTPSVLEWKTATAEVVKESNGQYCASDVPCDKLKFGNKALGEIVVGGSAHPFTDETVKVGNASYLSLRQHAYVSNAIPFGEKIVLYTLEEQNGTMVPDDLVAIPVERPSYTHSFGVALSKTPGKPDHAVIAQQPLHYHPMDLVAHGTLQAGLQVAKGKGTKFYVTAVEKGAKPVEFETDPFFFGHFVNSWDAGDGVFVADINMEAQIFFDRYSLDVVLNKTLRDTWANEKGYETVVRYELDTTSKTVKSTPLWGQPSMKNIGAEFDLFRLHPEDYGKPYCGFWAWQDFYNSTSWASWAIVRTEICGPEPKVAAVWYRPNVYPGEAAFVPKPGSTDKTEGVLVFKATSGVTRKTSLVVADAKTLETIAEADLPINIPYAVHGNWFPDK
eukprot:Hpha_TRINITY_DN16303_c2_g4::TRINITY_DN16303_c2_g4_i1::g.61766::m.61766